MTSTVEFQPTDWYIVDTFGNITYTDNNGDIQQYNRRGLVIKAFGRQYDGRSVGINILGFKPFFYIECKNASVDAEGVKDYINTKIPTKPVASIEIVAKHKFRYFSDKPSTYLKVSFALNSAYKKAISYFKWSITGPDRSELGALLGMLELNLAEIDITPELRLFHMLDIQPCGWLKCKLNSTNNSRTLGLTNPNSLNYDVWWEDISALAESDIKVNIAPFKILSFDIECTSPTGVFPHPINSYSNLCEDIVGAWELTGGKMTVQEVVQNTVFLFTQNRAKSIFRPILFHNSAKKLNGFNASKLEKVLITYVLIPNVTITKLMFKTAVKVVLEDLFAKMVADGDIPQVAGEEVFQIGLAVKVYGTNEVEKILLCQPKCGPIEGATVISYTNERGLLEGFRQHMISIDPDLIIGWNTNAFDYMFIIERCTALGITIQNEFRYRTLQYSKLQEDLNYNYFSTRTQKVKQSAAFGTVENDVIISPGRVNIDVMKVIQQEHQLESYKLDDVASLFINGTIDKILDENRLEVSGANDIEVGNYMKIRDDFKLKALNIEHIDDKTIVTVNSTSEVAVKSKWGLAKDDVSVKEIFASYTGTEEDRAVVGKYCIQDCVVVLKIVERLSIFTNALAMANVCYIPLDWVYWKGQNIRSYSLITKTCTLDNYIVPELSLKDKTAGDGCFEGATVLSCIPGMYADTGVIVLDFASLYPSSIITENISHETILKDEADLAKAKALGYNVNTVTYSSHLESTITCRYISADSKKGILPTTIQRLLAARKSTRKIQKNHAKYSSEWKVLEGVQLAYKVVANSMYGTLGTSTSKLMFHSLAASVTSIGRSTISLAMSTIQQRYGGRIIYADTDSTWIVPALIATNSDLTTKEGRVEMLNKCIAMGRYINNDIKKYLKGVQDLEYEMVVYPLIMFTKKRYVGNIYEDDGAHCEGRKTMGIVLKRRDNAPILKEIFGGVIETMLNDTDNVEAIDMKITKMFNDFSNGSFPLKQFIITKKLLAHYANPSGTPHKVLADRMAERDSGTAPEANERLAYVIVHPSMIVDGDYNEKDIKMGQRLEAVSYLYQTYGEGMSYSDFINRPLNPAAKLDYSQYILTQLQKPLLQILELVFDKKLGLSEEIRQAIVDGEISNPNSDLGRTACQQRDVDVKLLCSDRLHKNLCVEVMKTILK